MCLGCTKRCQYIFCPYQRNRKITILFLDFFRADLCRTVIRHCSSHNYNIRLIIFLCHCLIHILCGNHWFYLNKHRRLHGTRTCYQSHIRTTQHGIFCNGITHFPGRMIGDITHRINRFLRRSGSHQHFFASQIFIKGDHAQNMLKQHFRFRHFSFSHISACKHTAGWFNNFLTIRSQHL